MLAYRNKVIKEIINRRAHNITEINKNEYGLYDKKQAQERIKQTKRFKDEAIDKNIKRSKYYDIYINNQTDQNELERYLKRHYKEQGLIEESIPSSNFMGYDKYGRKRDKEMEATLKKMLRPRELLGPGEISLGEQKVYDELIRLRGGQNKAFSQHGLHVPIDSLIESAFNSEENHYWEAYELSLRQPQVSECSQEQFNAYTDKPDQASTGHDQFSDLNNSGSSLSSDYSNLDDDSVFGDDCSLDGNGTQRRIENFMQPNQRMQKYCFFKIIQGLKLPMLIGNLPFGQRIPGKRRQLTERLGVPDLIDISQRHMLIQKRKRNKKLSYNFIDKIFSIYQEEMGAAPLDLMKGIQVGGHIVFNNYHLSVE